MEEKRPMTDEEFEAAKCLSQPRYPVASWDKRFAAYIHGMVTMTPPLITDRAAPQVWRLFRRYRKHIQHINKRGLLAIAELRSAPDYRSPTYRKAQEQQAEIDRLKAEAATGNKEFTQMRMGEWR